MRYFTINCYKKDVEIKHHLDQHLETINQVKDLINNLIALYESYIIHYKKALETSEKYLNKAVEVLTQYTNLIDEIKQDKEQYLGCVDFKPINTQNGNYYTIRDFVESLVKIYY